VVLVLEDRDADGGRGEGGRRDCRPEKLRGCEVENRMICKYLILITMKWHFDVRNAQVDSQ
jgi:hypothetical protein